MLAALVAVSGRLSYQKLKALIKGSVFAIRRLVAVIPIAGPNAEPRASDSLVSHNSNFP
jgi:hypothetical protein